MSFTRKAVALLGCALAAVALAACGEATVGSGVTASKAAAKSDPPGAAATPAGRASHQPLATSGGPER